MKILHAIPSLKIGGAERIAANLATALAHRGHEVSVLLFEPVGENCFQVAKDVQVKVIGSSIPFKYDIVSLFRVLHHLQKQKFDVVHTHLTINNTLVRFLAALSKTPVIIGHEHGGFLQRDKLAKLFMKRLEKHISYNVYISEHDLQHYTKHDKSTIPDKHVVVHNPLLIKPRPYKYDAERKVKVIGMVGRIVKFKGHYWALQTLAPFIKNHGCKVVIVGDGEESLKKELLLFADTQGIRLEITGYTQTVEDYYSMFDLLVHPSFTEGFGLAIIEAMAFGLPVVASNVGGIPNIIRDGYNGLLFEAGNGPDLLRRINQVVTDEGQRQHLSKNAYASVLEKFSFEQYVATIEKLYLDSYHKKKSPQ